MSGAAGGSPSLTRPWRELDFKLLAFGSVQQNVDCFFAEFFKRLVEAEYRHVVSDSVIGYLKLDGSL